jgi:hypothetical protein
VVVQERDCLPMSLRKKYEKATREYHRSGELLKKARNNRERVIAKKRYDAAKANRKSIGEKLRKTKKK